MAGNKEERRWNRKGIGEQGERKKTRPADPTEVSHSSPTVWTYPLGKRRAATRRRGY